MVCLAHMGENALLKSYSEKHYISNRVITVITVAIFSFKEFPRGWVIILIEFS